MTTVQRTKPYKPSALIHLFSKISPLQTRGERIRRARREAGFTQDQLAKMAGVSKSAVSQWEGGDIKKITADNFLAMAKALNVNAIWLPSGKGPMRQQQTQSESGQQQAQIGCGQKTPHGQPEQERYPVPPEKQVPLIKLTDVDLFLRNPDKEGLEMTETSADVDVTRSFAIDVPGEGGGGSENRCAAA
jgi:transcriptional regulator with XRE-family HTH domain